MIRAGLAGAGGGDQLVPAGGPLEEDNALLNPGAQIGDAVGAEPLAVPGNAGMQELGADIPKIAVMPQNKKDVLTLLAATEEMANEYADRPIITMSMAGTGVISRLAGEVFGSALTFGAAAKASAPGQMGVEDLKQVLTLLHGAL